jgi:F-type H+-transporting ATPase subunit epsilon
MVDAGKDYSLTVLTPEGPVYSGDVVSLVAPGESGKLGVLAHHMPLLCALSKGELVCREREGAWLHFDIQEGILEVTPEGVRVLTDAAERVPIRIAPRF